MTDNKSVTEIDYLTEDESLANQKWCCVSFLSPEGIKNCKVRGFKVRGVFDSKEEADNRAQYLQKVDPHFDIFVGEVGKWLSFAPDPNSREAGDMVYAEKQLNDLAKAHKENQEKQKIMEAERREALKTKAYEEANGNRPQKVRDRLRKTLESRQTEKAKLIDEEKHDLTSETSLAKDESKRLNDVQRVINTKEDEVKSLDDNLAKIQELYNKMKSA
ncbi:MAG: hypothetical protein CMF62_00325 [Magnetococcales bacterium]|nr:hypothetical protein [Magnetococcales bacterium]|tara:strand:+ start:15055 stop:15705 length:651 start_codon:yes stop_codon:yes gene_type:complete